MCSDWTKKKRKKCIVVIISICSDYHEKLGEDRVTQNIKWARDIKKWSTRENDVKSTIQKKKKKESVKR